MMSSGLAARGMLGGRLGGSGGRPFSASEGRYQAAQPFEALRQRLTQHGVAATPKVMQSYQNQVKRQAVGGSSERGPSGGIMGKRSRTGGSGGAKAPVGRSFGSVSAELKRDRDARANWKPTGGMSGGSLFGSKTLGGMFGKRSKRRAPSPGEERPGLSELQKWAGANKADVRGGSFYTQRLTGSGAEDWKWNRTARAGTRSNQGPY